MTASDEVPTPDAGARWVDTEADLADVLAALDTQDVVALDTEFHRERSYWPHVALVQVAWRGGHVALLDAQKLDLRALAPILENPEREVILHAADQDLEVLERSTGTAPVRMFDTQIAAGFLGFSSPSLVSLVERVLGRRLAKGDRLTDWTRRPLTEAQKRYAADDVAHLIDLRDELVKRLTAYGRIEWVNDEFERLLRRDRRAQDPDTAWWRLKDNRSLRGPARGIAQEVAAWRERRAARLDRPTRLVLPDMAILGIANAAPTTVAALGDIRGLDIRNLRSGVAEEVLQAVEAGRRLGKDAVKVPAVEDVDRRLRPAVTLVSAWVAQLSKDLRIDAALLATRADLLSFLRDEPDARLGSGWRKDLLGERIRQLVEGDAALAFRPRSGDLVLERRSGEAYVVDVPVPPDDLSDGDGSTTTA